MLGARPFRTVADGNRFFLGGRRSRARDAERSPAEVLVAEAHRYVIDGFGCSTLLSGRNAADAIPWILEARQRA